MKCPHCENDIQDEKPAGNATRQMTLVIDEEMLPILTGLMRMASTRYGMYGYGILANKLNEFSTPLFEAKDEMFRGFEEGPWAQALFAHDKGYEMVFALTEDKKSVVIGCYEGPDDEKGRVLAEAFVAEGVDPDQKLAAVKDFFDRRTPIDRSEPENPSP